MKKKLDNDVVDLSVALEHANAANAETQRNIQLLQNNIRNVQAKFEEESRAKAAAQDNLIAADRRANANQNVLEEARTLLEQADRNRRNVEQELADTNESLSDQTCTNQAIQGAKMKCDPFGGSSGVVSFFFLCFDPSSSSVLTSTSESISSSASSCFRARLG